MNKIFVIFPFLLFFSFNLYSKIPKIQLISDSNQVFFSLSMTSLIIFILLLLLIIFFIFFIIKNLKINKYKNCDDKKINSVEIDQNLFDSDNILENLIKNSTDNIYFKDKDGK